jgi:ATP-dependent helicase/nuclease subunit B
MKPFLQRLAEDIVSRYGEDTGSLCVVLPNRRAGLYLRKYLSASLRKTIWAPETYSVEDFITKISGRNIMDPAGLIFELYAIHKELKGAEAQDFENFSNWAEILLKDFDEIDQYLADPEKVFTFINEARALTVWNLGERPLTEHESDYIRFYQSFGEYYSLLRERLLAKGQVYQGLAYRLGAEGIEQTAIDLPWRKILFAGLNALATAEEKIIGHLLKTGQAEIFWDADEYYVNDAVQEAGEFLREHFKKWPGDPVKWMEKEFRESEKVIRIFGIPGSTGQAIKAGQLIRELGETGSGPDKTALVLADESLLLPVLYSLPEETGPVNVTMGFPFRYTGLYQLIYLIFQLQENILKFSQGNSHENLKIYAKDLLRLLSHPYMFLWEQPKNDPDALADIIRSKNRVFLLYKEVLALVPGYGDEFKSVLGKVLDFWATPEIALDNLLAIMELIRSKMDERMKVKTADHELDLEYLFHLSKVIRRCRTLMEDYPFVNDLKTLRKVLFQVLDIGRLPFYGEPLKGLQVMGVLETRAIDFENLVVLSVNEGVLPSGRSSNSFIPFDIKQVFGLPTFQQKDYVFAYHFYRMIQRAKRIYLLYETEGDRLKGGEKSRFITQISYELPKINPRISIKEILLSPVPPDMGAVKAISMPKTPRVMQALQDKTVRGFSPSALNLYIRCPLQFYFQEAMGIVEAEEIEETIEAKTMGSAIHQALYNIYKPYVGKYVDPEQLKEGAKNTEALLKQAFEEYYREGDLEHGKNHLVYKVSQFFVKQLVKNDLALLGQEENPAETLQILHLEQKLDAVISCNSGSNNLNVRVKGLADRIDKWGKTIRIIDYKTGAVDKDELNVKSWESLADDPKMAKAFQLLVYAYLYHKNNPGISSPVISGNISLRKISQGVMDVKYPVDQPDAVDPMKAFEGILKGVLEDILDPEKPFDQTEDVENCSYCPFRSICCR